jgi:hypothetical protein
LDSGPIRPATCAGPDTQGRNAHASRPEAGARCGSSARRDLCGGWPARAIPTATGHHLLPLCVRHAFVFVASVAPQLYMIACPRLRYRIPIRVIK